MTVPIRQRAVLPHELCYPKSFQFILQYQMTLTAIQRRKKISNRDDFAVCKLNDEIVPIAHHAPDFGSSHCNLND